jgi:hypothetical protein
MSETGRATRPDEGEWARRDGQRDQTKENERDGTDPFDSERWIDHMDGREGCQGEEKGRGVKERRLEKERR